MSSPEWQSAQGSDDFIAAERAWQREQEDREYTRAKEAAKRADQIARDEREHRTERLGFLAATVGVLGAIGIAAWLIWVLAAENMRNQTERDVACFESGGAISVVNGAQLCVERPGVEEEGQ